MSQHSHVKSAGTRYAAKDCRFNEMSPGRSVRDGAVRRRCGCATYGTGITLNVAVLLVTLPELLLTTTANCELLSENDRTGVV